MKIIERVIACFLDILLGDGADLDTVEDFLIGIASILIPALIYIAVYIPLQKYAKWSQKSCNITAIVVTVGAILLFCMICFILDPPS